tara:strand:+ start:4075 stop:4320 length:246 start_codon:yes stop_codon:yes gene_type:complete
MTKPLRQYEIIAPSNLSLFDLSCIDGSGELPFRKEIGITANAAPRYKSPANWMAVKPKKSHLLAGAAAPNSAAENMASKTE